MGAAIGAVGGLLTADLRPDGAVAGAVIGAIISSWLALRARAYRAAISRARQDPQEAARQDKLQAQHFQSKRWASRQSPTKIDDMTDLQK